MRELFFVHGNDALDNRPTVYRRNPTETKNIFITLVTESAMRFDSVALTTETPSDRIAQRYKSVFKRRSFRLHKAKKLRI